MLISYLINETITIQKLITGHSLFMLQLFSAIKKNQFQVKPYNNRKLAYKLIFISLPIYLNHDI